MWKTPDVPNGGRSLTPGTTTTGQRPDGTKAQVGLENQTRMWSTPKASDGAKGGPNQAYGSGGTPPLPAQTAQWPTPSAMQDTKGDADIGAIQRREMLGKQIALAHRARSFIRPDLPTPMAGPTRWPARRIWRLLYRYVRSQHGRSVAQRLTDSPDRLNPIFVEWLMAWPPGHSLCACSEMEFILWQRRMRGALSALPMASAQWIWKPPMQMQAPQQMSLFEAPA